MMSIKRGIEGSDCAAAADSVRAALSYRFDEGSGDQKIMSLNLRGSWELPLEEASALTLRRSRGSAGVELVAVDDEHFAVARARLAASSVSPKPAAKSVQDAVLSIAPDLGQGSDFEGVASDSSRQLFVLQEYADRVIVLNPELDAVTHVIALSIKPDEPGFGQEWWADDNSRGEGLLLLRNGHILVAKQREEPRIIEFGPPGSEAAGFKPGDALNIDERFTLPTDSVPFDVLRSWPLAAGTQLESINDLAVDEDGRLHVISSRSRSLARLAVDLDSQGGSAIFAVWPLPAEMFADEEDKAEGLIFSPLLGWLVSLDLGHKATNLFQVDGVPP